MRLTALFATAMLAACGFLPPTPPDWVTNRLPLESCGVDDGAEADARRCLLEAFLAGQGAELISTESTIEGDPITRYVRVHENGVVEIFVDATQDRYGSGEWERIVCAELVPVEMPTGLVFGEQGCREQPVP